MGISQLFIVNLADRERCICSKEHALSLVEDEQKMYFDVFHIKSVIG